MPPSSLDPMARIPEPLKHRAAKIEDWFQEIREARALKRGKRPAIIPYISYGGDGWIRVLARILLVAPGQETSVLYENTRGWRSFTSIPLNFVEVTVRVGDEVHRVSADRGGIVDGVVNVSLPPGWHSLRLTMPGADEIEAKVFIVDSAVTRGVVSDIDDTVMVTLLPRPFVAAWNAFVLDEHARQPVPGMAVFYERLHESNPGMPFLYLSTGAWNAAPALTRFLSRNLYPSGPLLLTDWGPTHDRIFRSGRDHKESNLERLSRDFPNIQWLLVGDDGQHDEELYAEFAERHPDRVHAVAIRQLSPSEAVLAGGRKHSDSAAEETPVKWVYAPDGSGLAKALLNEEGELP
ncbi:App1 family protein [Humidisolicoccus flavus]|uniref:App1 family protein n=1 Tax=Humidisolicoccus flavus TaxID=3111414 RepID=UPI00324DA40F